MNGGQVDGSEKAIHLVPASTTPSTIAFDENYQTDHFSQRTPIIIDNGATDMRYGFAASPSPYVSTNVVAKYKDRKHGKQLLLFGQAVEADSASRLAVKTPWEGDVLCNSEALESGLDFVFLRLGIDSPSVDHPIIMAERLATPLPSRVCASRITSITVTSELLFEAYTAPSVVYGIDSILSHSYNSSSTPSTSRDGLVLSFNTASTSVIPVLDGRGILSQAKRLPWGGSQASEYLLKLLHLKYPNFGTKITLQQSTWMLHGFCSFSPSYTDTLKRLSTPTGMSAADVIIQFPYLLPASEEKTEEELTRLAEKRKESGRRLQEQAAKVRGEKLLQKEYDLQNLLALKEWKNKEKKADFAARMKAEGIESEAMLDEDIKRLEMSLRRARRKEEGLDDEPGEEPSFPLVDVPDHDLNDEQLKEKRRQRLMKAGYDARMRAKKEKEKERGAKEEQERQEQIERERDPSGWAARIRRDYAAVMERIKERKKRRAALTDRKSAAAQARMKNIASLADDQPPAKKRKKGGNDDMFGENDEDWMIYRQVNLDNASEEEEDDFAMLAALESKLLSYDPTFTYEDTYSAIVVKRSALMSAFRPKYEEGDVQGAHRIHLNVERWRVPEAWFGPPAAGVDAAGLGELIEVVLKTFSSEERARLVKDVFLTGGPALTPGLIDRVRSTLQPILAPDTPLSVSIASDARLDAWKGMAAFSRTSEFEAVSVTRAEYQEWGGERIKRWWGGNWNVAS